MTHQIIHAPVEAVYLSEFLTELPRGILNKGATGVGGTQLALMSPESYIVAVPTIEIIINKKNQNPEIIGVYGDTNFKEFSKEIRSRIKYKIFTTYDSLPKTVSWLSNLGINAYNTRLLVDEYHKILNDYSYRDKAIDNLLKQAAKFDYVTYLSATSIKPKFTPKILEALDYTEIDWSTKEIKLHRHRTNNPFAAVVKMITKYKANGYQKKIGNHISKEAYFFVNSVKSIKDIIDNAGLVQSEVKIICSETDRNRNVLGEDFSIGNVHDENKPFTFVTSKSFLGVDFYSESGVIYVVSNVNKKNTLLDISTDITQIAGRIRNINNPFKDTIFHIYNTGVYELTEEQFQKTLDKKVDDTNRQISIFNKLDPLDKEAFLVRYTLDIEDDYSYYNPETKLLEFNELKKLNEEFNYEVLYRIYNNGISIRQGYLDAGFKLEGNQEYQKVEEDFLSSVTSISYQSMLKQYVELMSKDELTEEDKDSLAEIDRLDPSIKQAVDILGVKRIRSLKYVRSKINNEIYSQCDEVAKAIKSNLSKRIVKGNFYSVNECKALLGDIYLTLKLRLKPKGVDILKYKEGTETSRKIDGKKVLGYCF